MKKTFRALTIAGSDSSGGAGSGFYNPFSPSKGIQADLKTFNDHAVYGMSAITALTAQNTTGVQGIESVSPSFVRLQLTSVLDDIGTDSVKPVLRSWFDFLTIIKGMLSTSSIVQEVAKVISEYRLENIVVDPVMVATTGAKLLEDSAIEALKTRLIPLALIITPNLHEASLLIGKQIRDLDGVKEAAKELKNLGCKFVLVKGGHWERFLVCCNSKDPKRGIGRCSL